MSKLVIAEKPMLARDIARAITGKEVSESARLPISGNGYTVCACSGHLLELVKPDAIDQKWGMPWSLDVLPIEVHDWPKEPAVFERHTLEALKEKLDGRDLHFETTVSKKQENPPLPYNLTVLLSDMSERFGFTAAETQQITQDLRDKYKAITYNRSDSQYLKEEHREQAPAVLAQAMKNLGVRWPLDYRLHSKAFNDGNVTAHHGIIPQEADAPVSAMEPDEAKVYTAICERYAVQFLPPAVYDVSESTDALESGYDLNAESHDCASGSAVLETCDTTRAEQPTNHVKGVR